MRKEKLDNQGFSLVELIIVIAIMAILLVVLSPQYLKYVERARNSADLQNAAEIVSAVQIYVADPEAEEVPADGTVTVGNSSPAAVSNDFLRAALQEAGLLDASGQLLTICQSRTEWTGYSISATVSDGGIQFTYDSTGDDDDTFSSRMLGATVSVPEDTE